MKESLTDNFLLLLADLSDFNQKFSSLHTALAMAGDPRLSRHRRWMEKYIKNKKTRKKLYIATQNLKRRGYLAEKIFNNSKAYFLTPKARIKILRIESKKIEKKKLPKGQWLLVFFDIPEKRRRDRDIFRSILNNFGFKQLQKSVWISPYEVFKPLQKLIKCYNLDEYVKLLLVNKFETD